jgi:hypothetical protein
MHQVLLRFNMHAQPGLSRLGADGQRRKAEKKWSQRCRHHLLALANSLLHISFDYLQERRRRLDKLRREVDGQRNTAE